MFWLIAIVSVLSAPVEQTCNAFCSNDYMQGITVSNVNTMISQCLVKYPPSSMDFAILSQSLQLEQIACFVEPCEPRCDNVAASLTLAFKEMSSDKNATCQAVCRGEATEPTNNAVSACFTSKVSRAVVRKEFYLRGNCSIAISANINSAFLSIVQ